MKETTSKKSPKTLVFVIIAVVALIAIGIFVYLRFFTYRSVKIETYEGDVALERGGSEKDIFEGIRLIPEDRVSTGEDGIAELFIDSDKHVVASENSCFTVNAVGSASSGKVTIDLEYGGSLITIDNKLSEDSEFEVQTPNALCSVRGTIFHVSYDPATHTTRVDVTEGVVRVEVEDQFLDVNAGESVEIKDTTIYTVKKADGTETLVPYIEGTGGNGIDGDNALSEFPEGITGEIPERVVDGVVLAAYYYVNMTESDKATLDNIIDLCESGDEKSAAYTLPESPFREMSSAMGGICRPMIGNQNMYRIVYRDYKICGIAMDENEYYELYMIPVSDGMGYAIGYSDHSYSGSTLDPDISICYGHCDCRDGMFNGAFSTDTFNELPFDNPYDQYYHVTGSVINGYLDGELKISTSGFNIHGGPTPSEQISEYAKGIPQVIGTDASGEAAYTLVSKNGEESYTGLGFSWEPGFYYIFSALGGVSCIGNMERDDGNLRTYPY